MEQWKPISSYEGFYEVSDYGRVRSIERFVRSSSRNGGLRIRPSKILKQAKHHNGYLKVVLSRDGKVETLLVHRLVASAFCPRREGSKQVNHLNLCKTDNRAENLEWCTASENIRHAEQNGALEAPRAPKRKALFCKELNRTFVSSYEAAAWINEHEKSFSGNVQAMARRIRACCTGTTGSAYGYHWSDVNSEPSTTIPKGSTPKRVEVRNPS
ncbi:MAG: hypothetical protein EOM03_13315 [Clostridia bacterium]|nr:hypothetical protein [Clostridia bacterium]